MSEQRVQNLGQAISVLKQAAEQGRESGIFGWEDLELILQSIRLVNAIEAEQEQEKVKEQEKSKEESETSKE